MRTSITHATGDDFGTLEVTLERDDSGSFSFNGECAATLSFPLYAHEARRIMELLMPLADESDAQ